MFRIVREIEFFGTPCILAVSVVWRIALFGGTRATAACLVSIA